MAKSRGIWDIYEDIWHPQNNPEGIVNLGVAENVCSEMNFRVAVSADQC